MITPEQKAKYREQLHLSLKVSHSLNRVTDYDLHNDPTVEILCANISSSLDAWDNSDRWAQLAYGIRGEK